LLTVFLLAGTVHPALSAPALSFADDGRGFLYRAGPGEAPALVADRFGIPPGGLGTFLAANGITDPTRVPLGFEYRIPNPLAPRLEVLRAQTDRLGRDLATRTARVEELERAREELQAQADLSDAKAQRLAGLDQWWPSVITALVVALLGFAGTSWVTRLAFGRLAAVEHHARELAQELEERRRASLAERQQTSHYVIELENRVRLLERQPRLATGRRG
jgi:hypothetical protein